MDVSSLSTCLRAGPADQLDDLLEGVLPGTVSLQHRFELIVVVPVRRLFLRFFVDVLVVERVQVSFRFIFALLGQSFLLRGALRDLRLEGSLCLSLGLARRPRGRGRPGFGRVDGAEGVVLLYRRSGQRVGAEGVPLAPGARASSAAAKGSAATGGGSSAAAKGSAMEQRSRPVASQQVVRLVAHQSLSEPEA